MLEQLLRRLSRRPSSRAVWNPYRDPDLLHNLRVYLTYLLCHHPDVLIVGEAPGYRGCRLTGIPFTSGTVIQRARHVMFRELGSALKLDHVVSESTATALWNTLGENRPVPILWNAFPFHPHQRARRESNRRPHAAELAEGQPYLKLLYDLFQPRRLCGLGRVGQRALHAAFPDVKMMAIRHPAHGGQQAYLKGMARLGGDTSISIAYRRDYAA